MARCPDERRSLILEHPLVRHAGRLRAVDKGLARGDRAGVAENLVVKIQAIVIVFFLLFCVLLGVLPVGVPPAAAFPAGLLLDRLLVGHIVPDLAFADDGPVVVLGHPLLLALLRVLGLPPVVVPVQRARWVVPVLPQHAVIQISPRLFHRKVEGSAAAMAEPRATHKEKERSGDAASTNSKKDDNKNSNEQQRTREARSILAKTGTQEQLSDELHRG